MAMPSTIASGTVKRFMVTSRQYRLRTCRRSDRDLQALTMPRQRPTRRGHGGEGAIVGTCRSTYSSRLSTTAWQASRSPKPMRSLTCAPMAKWCAPARTSWRSSSSRRERPCPPPTVRVTFSRGTAAAELWRFGEDDLAAAALELCDDELVQVWRTAAALSDPAVDVPVEGRRVTNAHVICFACMQQMERRIRPLARQRRRPAKDLPGAIRAACDLPSPTSAEIHRLFGD